MCRRFAFAVMAVLVMVVPMRPAQAEEAGVQEAGVQEAGVDAVLAALGVPELLQVMREEGQAYGAELGDEFLPDGGGVGWGAVVARMYDVSRMGASVKAGLTKGLTAQQRDAVVAFFQSDTGKRIVASEIAARRAFLDPDTEEAARIAYREVKARANPKDKERLALLRAYVEVNDLIEFNVAGGMTASLRFYQGLAQGGGWDTTEAEMLAMVWEQEAETRTDTEEWLMSYLMMAYDRLSDADVSAYVTLSETPAGQALNRALFAGFDAMYGDLSYAMGLAVAAQMKGEDL